MFNKENFELAQKIKGYGSYKKECFDSGNKIKHVKEPIKVQVNIIKNINEYIEFINDVKSPYLNPVFYRGQTNADYLLTPNCLRVNPKNEHLMIEAFTRRFYDELNKCHSSMERLMLMQHYQLPTRCLDITESPLMALYFACSHMKKFRKKIVEEKDEDWGEIILFQEPDDDNEEKPEKLKVIESSNISVIANTAFMEEKFSLWHLGVRWKKDVDLGHDEKYIDLRSIVRRSYIVRVPQNNPRIKNQQGAFIMVNANMAYVKGHKSEGRRLTEAILEEGCVTYYDLMESGFNLNDKETWDLYFKKVNPYSEDNELDIFKTDPFDLRRLFYKKDGVQQVVLIPPDCKKTILEELRKFNITEDFVYPDMDNVANEISEQINKKN